MPPCISVSMSRFLVVCPEPSEVLNITTLTSSILVDVNMCDLSKSRCDFWEYKKFRYSEVIDGNTICALVGRIQGHRKWVFVQCLGTTSILLIVLVEASSCCQLPDWYFFGFTLVCSTAL